jgi:hypothetical protein
MYYEVYKSRFHLKDAVKPNCVKVERLHVFMKTSSREREIIYYARDLIKVEKSEKL